MSTIDRLSTAASGTPMHVALVLDRSGSMESCRSATIAGFNEYADEIRRTAEEKELQVQLTLTVFNDEIRMPLFQAPLGRLRRLTRKTYIPDGSTAMLDGVGDTLDRLEHHGREIESASVLVCVISDGMENASTRYSYTDIAERIQRLTGTNRWTFTYMGANQDLSRISEAFNIPEANIASFTADAAGTQDAWRRHARASSRRMTELSVGIGRTDDFYATDK